MAEKKFRQTSNALASVWGHTGPSGTGSASQRDPKRAGIKIDLPLTPEEIEAQLIADELAAEQEAAEKSADPRSSFDKKYDIRDGIAHMLSDDFRLLLVANDKMRVVCQRVDKIIITDGFGLTAEYIPAKNGTIGAEEKEKEKEKEQLHTIIAHTILQMGIVQALGAHDSAYLRSSHGKIRGLLRVLAAREDIKAHAASVIDTDSPSQNHHVHTHALNSYGTDFKGNFTRLFANLAALREALQEGTPINLTVDTPASSKVSQAMSLGTLYPSNTLPKPPQNLKDIMFTDFKRLVWGFEPTHQPLLIRHIFGESAGYRIFVHNTNRSPVAILISPYAAFET